MENSSQFFTQTESSNSKSPPASWTAGQVGALVRALTVEMSKGVCTDSNFKSSQWKSIHSEFVKETHQVYTVQQLQSKFNDLKRKYQIFHSLVENSGFGWNEEKRIPTAPQEVWDEYLKAHPKAAPFKNSTLENYEELDDIFNGRVATGKFATSSNETDVANVSLLSSSEAIIEIDNKVEKCDQPFVSIKKRKVDPIQKMATDLVEHLKKPNNIADVSGMVAALNKSGAIEMSTNELVTFKMHIIDKHYVDMFCSMNIEEQVSFIKNYQANLTYF